MNIGAEPAFPVATGPSFFHVPGMTYREWLIGMALGISGRSYDSTAERISHAMNIADGIIARLEREANL